MKNVEPMSKNPCFINEVQLAARQARSIRTIQNQRLKGGGIKFVKFGSAVRYRISDVEKWEAEHTFSSTTQHSILSGPSELES